MAGVGCTLPAGVHVGELPLEPGKGGYMLLGEEEWDEGMLSMIAVCDRVRACCAAGPGGLTVRGGPTAAIDAW